MAAEKTTTLASLVDLVCPLEKNSSRLPGKNKQNKKKSIFLPAITKPLGVEDLVKRSQDRRRSSRLRFMPGPTDIQKVVDNTLDRVDSSETPLITSGPYFPPPNRNNETFKPLSLWEKLALAAKDEEKRNSIHEPTDSIGLNVTSLTMQTRRESKPASIEGGDLTDNSDIEFGFPQTCSEESETENDNNKPKRFRVLARMVKNNLAWAREIRDKHDEDTTKFVVRNSGLDDGEALVFDLNNFRFQQRSYGGLTSRARRILLKHPIERSDAELQLLREVVERLKCFKKYHRKVKQEIARVIYYETFEDGRTIIQQGHAGFSFYFIISGKVQVKFEETDRKTGLVHTQLLGELCEGSSFGELALLHNIKRTATIVCRGNNCEFLRVDKADFETVLRESYEHEWTERLKIINSMPYFKTWDEKALTNLNNTCQIKEYLSGAVILSQQLINSDQFEDKVFFVSSGECLVVRDVILMIEPLPFGGQKVIFPSDKIRRKLMKKRDLAERRQSMYYKMERRFWQVASLKKGLYFNTGEDLTDTYIIANDRVECLLIPRSQFVKKGNNKILDKLRDDLNDYIPSNEQAFQTYISDNKWNKYKRSVVEGVVQRRNSSGKKMDALIRPSTQLNITKQYVCDNMNEITHSPQEFE